MNLIPQLAMIIKSGGKMFKKLTKICILVIGLSFSFYSCGTFSELLSSLTSSDSTGSNSGGNSNGSSTASSPTPIKADPSRRGDPDAANWDIAALDTAKDVDYLTGLEKDVVLEMNKARSNPKKYAELYMQPKLRYFNGNNYSEPGEITLITQEGKKAVENCISAMSKMQSSPLLQSELGLSLGARDHTADQSKTGKTGHDGSDKSTPFTRITRYGKGYKTAGENLAYGSTTGRDIIVDLLIDDGVPSRGHRTNIMNKSFSQTGVSFGTHTQYRTMCTITYANGYVSD
jgi:uncharacterized protein YkwD